MKIPVKKLKNGFSMPVFGLGTWTMGGDKQYNPDNDDEANIQAIKKAINAGITHIDAAENYAEGHAEKLVGRAIKDYDRSKLLIVSKVDKKNLRYNDLIRACKQSLKRLQTDFLNLYLIHAPNPEIPIKETMKAMNYLLKAGLIKNIGVSNFNIKRLKEAQSYSENKIVVNQLHLNLIVREIEKKGVLDFCQKNDIMVTAYRPLEKGKLAKKGTLILDRMADKYKKTRAQIAINWLISQQNVVTLSKMSNPKHLKENLGAVNWQMKEQDMEELRKKFPDQEDVSYVFCLV